jgi:hypothetical protein
VRVVNTLSQTCTSFFWIQHCKTPRHHTYLHQSSRIQNQFIKISSLSIYQQQTDWEIIQENNSVYSSLKKYLGINLTKEGKDLYNESYKSLKKEIEEDFRRWKDLPCSWIGRINIVKMAILAKAFYRFNAIPIEIPMTFITRNWKINPKVHMEARKTSNSQGNTEQKKRNTDVITIPYLKLYYRAIAIKPAWYWHKNRHEDQ